MDLLSLEIESLFRSVACSGAVMGDIKNISSKGKSGYFGHYKQYRGLDSGGIVSEKESALESFTPARAAQIQFAEKYQPKAITLTIGGNDTGFSDKIRECISNPLQSCKYATTQLAAGGKEIQNLFDELKATYDAVHAASPRTKVYVVGYPKFVNSDIEICLSTNVLLDKTEREYINQATMYLNDVVEAAARSTGMTYIDIENALEGNELCGRPQPFVNANG
ncbi:MAG: GDSL-type esterase/lipase family protein, partial [Candidatus Binatia bacterium]